MEIKITRGGVAGDDITEHHIVTNHLANPEKHLDKVLTYAQRRYLMTLLVSGARDSKYTAPGYTPKNGKAIETVITPVPEKDLIDSNSFYYRVMGRIQKAATVIGVAGTPTTGSSKRGGEFALYLADDFITNQMNVTFRNGKQARVMGMPEPKGERKWLYRFQCYPGDNFSESTWLGTGANEKKIFGGYTTVGERSRKGYGRFFFPDKYVQHTTKQRKSFSISGDADTNSVIWMEYNGAKGFSYEAELQLRAQFLMEDEHQKWWGKSTMIDEFGNLMDMPGMFDEETGEPIVAGSGIHEQIYGANNIEWSGADGLPTRDDLNAWIDVLKKNGWDLLSEPLILVGGSDARKAIARIAGETMEEMNYHVNLTLEQAMNPMTEIGYSFMKLNIDGTAVIFVENFMHDDPERFPHRLQNGKSYMSACMYALNFGSAQDGTKNIEIHARGREGINRNMVYMWENGMTGKTGVRANNPVDADAFHMFKENAIIARNTTACGFGMPPITLLM